MEGEIKRGIKNILKLRYCPRFSNQLMTDRQNVAEHSASTAMLAQYITQYINGKWGHDEFDANLITTVAVFHDFEETELGDIITYPTKRHPLIAKGYDELAYNFIHEVIHAFNPEVAKILTEKDSAEFIIYKFADMLDGFLEMHQQTMMHNNKDAEYIACKYMQLLQEYAEKFRINTGSSDLWEFLDKFINEKYWELNCSG